MVKANGWANHENTFEEELRKELLAAHQLIGILKEDLKRMTEAYYTVLKKSDEKRKLN